MRLSETADTTARASIGVAIFPENADSLQGLLRLADESMYTAKRMGKNRVVMAPQTGA